MRYFFDWSDGKSSQTGFVDSGTSMSLTRLWDVEGVYTVRVRAEDVRGATSEWSLPLEVTIVQSVNRIASVRRSIIFGS